MSKGLDNEGMLWDPLEAAVRSLRDEDYKKGVSSEKSLECPRCKLKKSSAGSKAFGEKVLCNDCLLAYARACFAEPNLGVEAFLDRPVDWEMEDHSDEEPSEAALESEEDQTFLAQLEERVLILEEAMDEVQRILGAMKDKNPKLFG